MTNNTLNHSDNSVAASGGVAVATSAPVALPLLPSLGIGGSAAVLSVNVVHPIETIKTRVQVHGTGVIATTVSLIRKEGMTSLWKGIQAAWGREAFYASIKIGGYGPVKRALGADGADASFGMKFLAGSLSGSLGAVVGNPFDVLKTLGQANKERTVPMPTLARSLYTEQGIRGFFRGWEVNCMRAGVLNGTRMAVYESSKELMEETFRWSRADPKNQVSSAVVSSFFITCTTAPFDMVRTHLMSQPVGKRVYSGFADCALQLFRQNGLLSFWRGFGPIWARQAPASTLQIFAFESLLVACGYDSV